VPVHQDLPRPRWALSGVLRPTECRPPPAARRRGPPEPPRRAAAASAESRSPPAAGAVAAPTVRGAVSRRIPCGLGAAPAPACCRPRLAPASRRREVGWLGTGPKAAGARPRRTPEAPATRKGRRRDGRRGGPRSGPGRCVHPGRAVRRPLQWLKVARRSPSHSDSEVCQGGRAGSQGGPGARPVTAWAKPDGLTRAEPLDARIV
jgi:hypothetical protein